MSANKHSNIPLKKISQSEIPLVDVDAPGLDVNKVDINKIDLDEIAPSEVGEIDFYQKRERIYTRPIKGFYQRIRLLTGWPLLIAYFGLPWLQWGDRQAVLFDLPARQFHLFFISLWPQDLPLLAWLLIIAAFLLFTVTVWAGRVWCGYTCPQTVWTSIFMWAEQITEGTRNQRIKLDAMPWSWNKLRKKIAKHSLWLGFAALTGLTFVAYFVPVRELLADVLLLEASHGAYAWILFFTLATYINAGWLREQVCMYMCPYARFQSAMFDGDTLIVAYDNVRGEARGSRKITADPVALNLGDCIDCKMCVQVCSTGIDIRDGLQYECITCALCIDACDAVMEKMQYDTGLIKYTTEKKQAKQTARILRPRLLGYLGATLIMSFLFLFVIFTRTPLSLDVMRERDALYYALSDARFENLYLLKIMNMSQQDQAYIVSLEGLDNAQLIGDITAQVRAGEVYEMPLRIQMHSSDLDSHRVAFTFYVESQSGKYKAGSESRFLSPLNASLRASQ